MWKQVVSAALVLCVVATSVAGQSATFVSAGKPVTEVKAGSFEELSVRFPVADSWKSKDFTIMSFYFKPDHWKVDGATWTIRKEDLGEHLKDGFVTLTVVQKGTSKADLAIGGRASNLAYLTEFPRRDRMAKITCTAWAKAYRKTGENIESRWNSDRTKLTTYTVPVYDAGKMVCKGQVTVHQLAPRSEVSDPAGVFQVKLVNEKLEYGMIAFEQRGVKASGVWIDTPAGKDQFGKPCKLRVSYLWVDKKQVTEQLGQHMNGQDAFTWMKSNIKGSLFYKGGRVARPVFEWKDFITRPSQHDFRHFGEIGEQWKEEEINGLTFQQLTGMNQQGARQACFGCVSLAEKDGRIYIASCWMLRNILAQGQAKFTSYAEVVDQVSKTFRVLK